jgi:UDP-N-acetylmuramate dehydrogenase
MKAPLESLISRWWEQEPMSSWTTLKLGGKAKVLCRVENENEFFEVINWSDHHELPTLILGGGSNILFSDQGFKGVVIVLGGEFMKIEVLQDEILLGCGLKINSVISSLAKQDIASLSGLYGMPGTIGGAAVMNAGTKWGTISEHLTRVKTYESGWRKVKPEEMDYRRGISEMVLKVMMSRQNLPAEEIESLFTEIRNFRNEHFPQVNRTAGSVFKNPLGEYAGALIEKCGWKGKSYKQVRVSDKHANFFITEPGADTQQFLTLMKKIKQDVDNKYSIELEQELRIYDYEGIRIDN